VSLRYLSGFGMVSVDVREVIVAGWWRGWELCSELGSFGSTVVTDNGKVPAPAFPPALKSGASKICFRFISIIFSLF